MLHCGPSETETHLFMSNLKYQTRVMPNRTNDVCSTAAGCSQDSNMYRNTLAVRFPTWRKAIKCSYNSMALSVHSFQFPVVVALLTFQRWKIYSRLGSCCSLDELTGASLWTISICLVWSMQFPCFYWLTENIPIRCCKEMLI